MKSKHSQMFRVDGFFGRHSAALATQGSVVATWRSKQGRRTGPYFRLDVRDPTGRKLALYLGRDSSLVAEVRARLAMLQHPRRQHLSLEELKRNLRSGRKIARVILVKELEKVGLRLQGSEVRGFVLAKRALELAARQPGLEGEEMNFEKPNN